MPKHGKKYLAALSKVDRTREYSPREAIELVKEISFANFDETVELHLRLGIDPRHSDQQVRTTVVLPHGLGKPIRVLVFAEGEAAHIAENAGADYVGSDEYIERITKEGWLEFDVALAVPEMMRKVGRLGRILGRRGLMPNPKAGTVVKPEDLPQAIQLAKAGRIEFRNDKTGNVHVPIGKVSFPVEKLLDNMAAVMDAVKRARPAAAKGTYVRRVVVKSTMGPGVKVNPQAALEMQPSV